jgi:ribosomal 50S subunit-recycling heat shock protein
VEKMLQFPTAATDLVQPRKLAVAAEMVKHQVAQVLEEQVLVVRVAMRQLQLMVAAVAAVAEPAERLQTLLVQMEEMAASVVLTTSLEAR